MPVITKNVDRSDTRPGCADALANLPACEERAIPRACEAFRFAYLMVIGKFNQGLAKGLAKAAKRASPLSGEDVAMNNKDNRLEVTGA